ncbi:MAG TPA: aminotransferase class I/II-fold pyridoxal phosphate-dependent enzyme [Candidatus Acidoferrales bacterium]|nr:aminotransferase class I/II-fold pyridoxal phosphate-dependent enzyme [Candidatus Acidoferrales bacterium]
MLEEAIRPSRRAEGVEYAIRDVISKAEEVRRGGKRIIHLNIGDPVKYGFDTPPHIKDAMKKAIDTGANYYSASEGLKELREAVADKENTVNHAQIEARNVVITQGISEAIMFLMGALVNAGDEVLMPGPCYSPYITYTKFFEGKPVTYRTIEENDWAPDLSDLETKVTERTRLIVVINPNNPTGSLYSERDLSKILEIAAAQNIPVAADEIYDRIVFDSTFTSLASIAKDVPIFCLNGFSKAYLMTGWRLGYIYTQDPNDRLKHVWEAIEKISRVRLCASTPAQFGGLAALTGPQGHIAQMVSTLRRRRDFALKRLTEIPGLTATKPRGAFYLFPKVQLQGTGWNDDKEFVTKLLEETGVLVVHGSGFDPAYGSGHFRSVFLPEESMMSEAFDAIDGFMKRHA